MPAIHHSSARGRLRGFLGLLGAALLFACSDAAGPGENVPVASLSVKGTPTSAMLVDNTTQLSIVALDKAGAVIRYPQVSWSSSDETVATVTQDGLVKARGAGRATITASSGDQKATTVIDVRGTIVVGPAGGTFTIMNGQVVISVPANAVSAQSIVTFAPPVGSQLPVDSRIQLASAVNFTSEWYMPGVTVMRRYDPAALPTGGNARALQLFSATSSSWSPVPSTVDTVTRMVQGTIALGGVLALGYTPVDHLVVEANAWGISLVESQTSTLSTIAYDARNAVLPNRTVSWISSNPSVASVDVNGKVTGVAPGTATITGTCEGKQASTGVSVISRPVVDWSAVADWQTYQGNAQHSGYVSVTADPSVFREKWVATPLTLASLNPVSTAPGAVFVTGNTGPTTQVIASLDAATGAVRWTYTTTAEGFDAPANANGIVYVQSSGYANSFLWAFDASAGTVRFQSPYANQWARYYAPVVDGGAVYMAGGYYDGMYSFTADAGAQRWFAATNQYERWSPAVKSGYVYAYTGLDDPKVSVVDAATGATSFEIPDPQFSGVFMMNMAPALGDANDLLATNGGRLISFDLQGRKIGWQQTGGFTGSVAVAGGQLYVINFGQLEIRSEATGSLIGTWVPPQGQAQAPVLATRNLVFVSTSTTTYAVDIATRRTAWSYPLGGALALGGDGTLFIAQPTGRLAAVALK